MHWKSADSVATACRSRWVGAAARQRPSSSCAREEIKTYRRISEVSADSLHDGIGKALPRARRDRLAKKDETLDLGLPEAASHRRGTVAHLSLHCSARSSLVRASHESERICLHLYSPAGLAMPPSERSEGFDRSDDGDHGISQEGDTERAAFALSFLSLILRVATMLLSSSHAPASPPLSPKPSFAIFSGLRRLRSRSGSRSPSHSSSPFHSPPLPSYAPLPPTQQPPTPTSPTNSEWQLLSPTSYSADCVRSPHVGQRSISVSDSSRLHRS